MKRKPHIIKPALLEDMIETDSVCWWIEAGPAEVENVVRVSECLNRMRAATELIKRMGSVNWCPGNGQLLAHNLRMGEMRYQIRLLIGPSCRPCFKCVRLFVDEDLSHRGCQECFTEYLSKRGPRPQYHPHDDFDDLDYPDGIW